MSTSLRLLETHKLDAGMSIEAVTLVTPISTEHQNTVEKVLAQWREWATTPALTSEPQVVTYLCSGSGHQVVLVRTAAASDRKSGCDRPQHYVLRFTLQPIERAGYELANEAHWMLLAHQQGLAPTPVFIDLLNGAIVMDYIPPQAGLISPADIGQLLHDIHQLPATGSKIDLKAIYVSYIKLAKLRSDAATIALDSAVNSPVARQIEQAPRKSTQSILLSPEDVGLNRCLALLKAGPQCLCHNDLTSGNILNGPSGIMAIDWEYAGIGSPWFDIAAALADMSVASSHAQPKQEATTQPTYDLQLFDAGAQSLLPEERLQARQQLLKTAGTQDINAPLLAVAEAVYDTLAIAWQHTQCATETLPDTTAPPVDNAFEQAHSKALGLRLRNAADAAEMNRHE